MEDSPESRQTLKYVTNRGWWTPTLLLALVLPGQIHSGRFRVWMLVDVTALVPLILVLYIVTHPILNFSPQAISLRRGPLCVSIDLRNLSSVRISTTARQIGAIDPQTGQSRQVNFYFRQSDDWAGKRPATGVALADSEGHHLVLRFLRTGADRWGAYVLSAISQQPEVDLGPRVMETLERIVR